MADGLHALAEDVSLELHRAVAERLLEEPRLVEKARRRVAGWHRDGSVSIAHAEAWRGVLAEPVARGVGEGRAGLPSGWEERLVSVPAPAGRGLCLEPHDLVISKCAAGRERDREYVRVAIRHRLVAPSTLRERLAQTPVDPASRERIARQIDADSAT